MPRAKGSLSNQRPVHDVPEAACRRLPLTTKATGDAKKPKRKMKSHDEGAAHPKPQASSHTRTAVSSRSMTKPSSSPARIARTTSSSSSLCSGEDETNNDRTTVSPLKINSWIRPKPHISTSSSTKQSRKSDTSRTRLTRAMANLFFDVDSPAYTLKQQRQHRKATPSKGEEPQSLTSTRSTRSAHRTPRLPRESHFLAASLRSQSTDASSKIDQSWTPPGMPPPPRIPWRPSSSNSSSVSDDNFGPAVAEVSFTGRSLDEDRVMSGALPVKSDRGRRFCSRVGSKTSAVDNERSGSATDYASYETEAEPNELNQAAANTAWPADAEAQDWGMQAAIAESIKSQRRTESRTSQRDMYLQSVPPSRSASIQSVSPWQYEDDRTASCHLAWDLNDDRGCTWRSARSTIPEQPSYYSQ